jgi:hypothetical protein
MSTGKKMGIGIAVLVCVPVVVAGMVSGAKQSLSKPAAASPARPAASTTTAPHSATTTTPAAAVPAAAAPTFTYPGDPQCAITYRDNGDGTMSWTATTTVAGELITHASGTDGTIYRHDDHIDAGTHAYRAPVPLAQIGDIGGNLRGTDASYGCSVAPQH